MFFHIFLMSPGLGSGTMKIYVKFRVFGGTNTFNGLNLIDFMMVQSRCCGVPQENRFDVPWPREWYSENLREISRFLVVLLSSTDGI